MDFRIHVLLIFVILFLLSEANDSNILSQRQSRIIGGKNAEVGRYPYAQISLQRFDGTHICGASLVAPDLILTAAHCQDSFNVALLNQYNLSDTFEIFEEFLTLDQIIHPKYSNETDQFDVMLVKLNGTSLVDTVRINDNPDEPRDDSRLTVVGWGITEEDNASSHPNIFQEVDLVHLNNDECKVVKNEYGQYYDYWITDDMLCAMAMARNRDSCFGDSGSPLIQQGDTPEEDIQVGIVSWGVGCDGSMPGVHSRLSSFSDWIREMTCFFSEAPSKHTGCMPTTPTLPPTFSLFTAPQLSSTSPLSTVRNETEDYSIPNSVIEIDDLKENVSRDYEDGEIETESSDTSNSNASNLVPSIFVVLCTLYQINVISRF